MAIQIGRYNFDGPFGGVLDLEDRSGVYAILSFNGTTYDLVDVGESANVRSRVANHDRAECWRQHAVGALVAAVFYTPHLHQAGRRAVEQELRKQYTWPCGDR